MLTVKYPLGKNPRVGTVGFIANLPFVRVQEWEQ